MGVLIHGFALDLYIIPDDCVADGSNVVIECIHRSLTKLKKKLGEDMPMTWYLQMDSATVNKSRWTMCYVTHCVASGVVGDVELHFLMVGHTHEDIDGEGGIAHRRSACMPPSGRYFPCGL